MMPRSLALLTLLLTVACARSAQQAPSAPAPAPAAAAPAPAPSVAATPQPAAFNPVGTYDFTTRVEGTDVSGSVIITSTDGRYGGTVTTSATPEIPIKSVSVAGTTVTVVMATPDGDGVLDMKMEGEAFTGSWSFGGMSGTLTGRRRASGA